jgi:hypothetical protein
VAFLQNVNDFKTDHLREDHGAVYYGFNLGNVSLMLQAQFCGVLPGELLRPSVGELVHKVQINQLASIGVTSRFFRDLFPQRFCQLWKLRFPFVDLPDSVGMRDVLHPQGLVTGVEIGTKQCSSARIHVALDDELSNCSMVLHHDDHAHCREEWSALTTDVIGRHGINLALNFDRTEDHGFQKILWLHPATLLFAVQQIHVFSAGAVRCALMSAVCREEIFSLF